MFHSQRPWPLHGHLVLPVTHRNATRVARVQFLRMKVLLERQRPFFPLDKTYLVLRHVFRRRWLLRCGNSGSRHGVTTLLHAELDQGRIRFGKRAQTLVCAVLVHEPRERGGTF